MVRVLELVDQPDANGKQQKYLNEMLYLKAFGPQVSTG
jgi:hypothetical protein